MIELLIGFIVPLLMSLMFATWRLDFALSFFISSLLAAIGSIAMLPYTFEKLLGYLGGNTYSYILLITFCGTWLLLLIGFMVLFLLFVPLNKRAEVLYPQKISRIFRFLLTYTGSVIFICIMMLGLSSLPILHKYLPGSPDRMLLFSDLLLPKIMNYSGCPFSPQQQNWLKNVSNIDLKILIEQRKKAEEEIRKQKEAEERRKKEAEYENQDNPRSKGGILGATQKMVDKITAKQKKILENE